MKFARPSARRVAFIGLICLALSATSVWANDAPYFPVSEVDFVTLLPPPPAPGSAEQTADLETVVLVHKAATPADLAVGRAQEDFDVFTFAPIVGEFFRPDALPKTATFFHRVDITTENVEHSAKKFYKRARPYQLDPSLGVMRKEPSYSYPSGHSTEGTVEALLLADLFPEKRDEILALGRNMGWHRVQMGKHYPTDIYAGRVLAQAIVRELKTNPAFQQDFAAAKAELAVATQPAHATP